MWYIVLAKDTPNTLPLRLAHRPAHLERLNLLNAQGRLKMAGPMPAVDSEQPGDAGFIGSLLVVAFDSIEQARAWVDEDPYFLAGVYSEAQVFPFKPVLP